MVADDPRLAAFVTKGLSGTSCRPEPDARATGRARLERCAQPVAHVWSDAEVESNVIDVYVRYLRQKVDAPFGQPLIHTIRGVGYTLRAP
jgi:hypothetical protein